MDRYGPAAALLGRMIAELDQLADLAAAINHHVPGQVSDLTGPQSGLHLKQNDETIAQRISGAIGEQQEVAEMI